MVSSSACSILPRLIGKSHACYVASRAHASRCLAVTKNRSGVGVSLRPIDMESMDTQQDSLLHYIVRYRRTYRSCSAEWWSRRRHGIVLTVGSNIELDGVCFAVHVEVHLAGKSERLLSDAY